MRVTLPACATIFLALSASASAVLAQGEVRIPSDAQIERMEERAIKTNPLEDSAGRLRGGAEAEIRQMDENAHRVDERLMRDSGICANCE